VLDFLAPDWSTQNFLASDWSTQVSMASDWLLTQMASFEAKSPFPHFGEIYLCDSQ